MEKVRDCYEANKEEREKSWTKVHASLIGNTEYRYRLCINFCILEGLLQKAKPFYWCINLRHHQVRLTDDGIWISKEGLLESIKDLYMNHSIGVVRYTARYYPQQHYILGYGYRV